jgi:hypothetical protein
MVKFGEEARNCRAALDLRSCQPLFISRAGQLSSAVLGLGFSLFSWISLSVFGQKEIKPDQRRTISHIRRQYPETDVIIY